MVDMCRMSPIDLGMVLERRLSDWTTGMQSDRNEIFFPDHMCDQVDAANTNASNSRYGIESLSRPRLRAMDNWSADHTPAIQYRPNVAPYPSLHASVYNSISGASVYSRSSSIDVPFHVAMNDRHHRISARTPSLMGIGRFECRMATEWSIIRRR